MIRRKQEQEQEVEELERFICLLLIVGVQERSHAPSACRFQLSRKKNLLQFIWFGPVTVVSGGTCPKEITRLCP